MKEYIDREKLKQRLQDFSKWCRDGRKQGVDFVLDCPLPDIPNEDVVPRSFIYQIFRDIWDICQETDDDEIIIDTDEFNELERKYGVL